jgi:large subunit ribosomal protein L23
MSGHRSPDQLLQRPVISEKSYAAMADGKYIFRCYPYANKIEIKRAVEEAFADQKVTVVAVNTLNVRGKERQRSRGQKRINGHSPNWKKAIVTLAPGQKIKDLFEGV